MRTRHRKKKIETLAGGKFLSINKIFIRYLGIETSGFLAILLGWNNHLIEKNKMPDDGFFYLEQARIEKEYSLSEFVQRKNLKLFKKWGFLTIERRGVPPKNWYYIDNDKFNLFFEYLSFKTVKIKDLNLDELELYYNKNNYSKNNSNDSYLKIRRKRFSNENHNISNSDSGKRIKPKAERKTRNKLQAEERKSKTKYRRKDIRQKTNITKIPPYVINLIEQWNSYTNTTSHRINEEAPSKTIKQIHRYFIQLRAGKMSGLDPAWKKRCKIPDKKYSIDELKQGIEYLSKFSQNDYWPQEKAPWTKNLPALLYNKENGKSLFMQVMQIPPKKLSEMKKIQYPSLVEKFTKAKIWEKAPNQHELDRVMHGLVSFWEHLQRWSKDPNIRQLVYYRLYEQYYTGYIGFLEGSSIILNDVWMLGINKWPFREYMEECQEILYYRGVTDIKPAELLKRFIDKS